MPFIYYIGKENALIAFDEYKNKSLSLMVDRVRTHHGDPRFFVAELQRSPIESDNVVFLHRLPHMKLEQKVLDKINRGLFFGMYVIAATWEYSWSLFTLMSTF